MQTREQLIAENARLRVIATRLCEHVTSEIGCGVCLHAKGHDAGCPVGAFLDLILADEDAS